MRVSKGKEFYNKYGTYIILIVLVLFFSFADGSILDFSVVHSGALSVLPRRI